MKVAIVIAVENYLDSAIKPVKYANADATDLAAALLPHGYAEADRVLLVGADATKAEIESQIENAVGKLTEEDTLLFYYSGRGFSKDGKSYLTCIDTELPDLEATSIKLESLLEYFHGTAAKRLMMFLDACEDGMLTSSEMKAGYADFAIEELGDFFSQSEHRVCLTACKPGETSWPSNVLKHSVWAHHIIEAFKGNAPLAVEQGVLLTAASLQKYLTLAMPRSLREAYSDKKVQTPALFHSANSEFLLADLRDLLEGENGANSASPDQVVRMTLVRERVSGVKQLSGFKSNHRLPSDCSASSQSFIRNIANDDVRNELNAMLASLRRAFGFKRIDLQSDFTSDGSASIITPYFNYTLDIALSEEDVTEVLWRQEVNAIKELNEILSDEFEQVFGKTFDTIEFSMPRAVDLETLIDRIEQLESEQISIDYDSELSWCTLNIAGEQATIFVTPTTMEIVRDPPEPPKVLIESFFKIQRALVDTHNVSVIEFKER